MKHQRIMWGFAIALFINLVGILSPSVGQPPILPTKENIELVEAGKLTQNVMQLYQQGSYYDAIPKAQKSLAIREKILGKYHLDVAKSLNNLAALYQAVGELERAVNLSQRSLDILEIIQKKDDINIATFSNTLASLYDDQAKYELAEPLYERSLSIFKILQGEEGKGVATTLHNLALLHQHLGRYNLSESLYKQALSIRIKTRADSSLISQVLNALAELYRIQGKCVLATPLVENALSIRGPILTDKQSDMAGSLNNLAELYRCKGDYELSERTYKMSLSMLEDKLEIDHPNIAFVLNNLALVSQIQGKYKQSESYYRRALSIREKVFGVNHLNVSTVLNNLATLYCDLGDIPLATKIHSRALIIQEKNLSKSLFTGSERDKQDYTNNVFTSPNLSIYMALRSGNTNTQKLAFEHIIYFQGRVLESMSEITQSIRSQLKNRPDFQQLFDKWKTILQLQSDLQVSKAKEENSGMYRSKYDFLERQRQNLEIQFSAQSKIFRQTFTPIKLESLQSLIPKDSALVQITGYRSYNSRMDDKTRWGSLHYAAAVLRSNGNPHWVDLGAAEEIDKNIKKFREYLHDGSSTVELERNEIARTLNLQLMKPIRQYLGDANHLLLSPDSALNLIPFEALKDEDNKYLIERYAFSYLSSGRDLMRFAASPPSRQDVIVFSEINYDQSTSVSPPTPSPVNQTRLTGYEPLETSEETKQIQSVFKNAVVFRDRDATKTALKKVQAPLILHLATHGFFTPAQHTKKFSQKLDNPLIRSGIILAGANQKHQSPELSGEGILTGLEASGLDLYGTQLVVLSACETGLGDISAGEGLYGLRRALVIAGSQSQVLSLWKVDNPATTQLMKQFYQNLKIGMGRHEALRNAQLKLLRSQNYKNPHNWAAFIPSGNWEPLRVDH
jgi:CHAT domain-containing protein/Tfp pilus assembly protein PilF